VADPFTDGEGEIIRAEHISPRKTGDNIQAKRVANYAWNGSTWERQSSSITVAPPKASDEYGINAISEDVTYKYFWFEADDLDYYIMRKHLTTGVFTFTKGTGGYTTVYVNSTSGPSGSPTWGTRGETF